MASKSKKRRRVFRASCILAALIIAGSSFAWFTSKDEVTNRLTASSDYGVSIIESFTPPKMWQPGQEVNKDVYAVNTGNIAAYVKENVSGVLNYTFESKVGTWDNECLVLNDTAKTAIDGVTTNEAGGFLAWTSATTKGWSFDDGETQVKVGTDDANIKAGDKTIGGTTYKHTYVKDGKTYVTTADTLADNTEFLLVSDDGTTVQAAGATGNLTLKEKDFMLELGEVASARQNEDPAVASRWTPSQTGVYIFRRSVKHDDPTPATHPEDDTFTYAGYYYDANTGKYYKIVLGDDDFRTYKDTKGNDVFDIYAAEGKLGGTATVNRDGTINGTPKVWYVKEKTIEDTPVNFTYDDNNGSPRLVVEYGTAIPSTGTEAGYDAVADAARKQVDLVNKKGQYDQDLTKYEQAVADYNYALALANARDKLQEAAAKMTTADNAVNTPSTGTNDVLTQAWEALKTSAATLKDTTIAGWSITDTYNSVDSKWNETVALSPEQLLRTANVWSVLQDDQKEDDPDTAGVDETGPHLLNDVQADYEEMQEIWVNIQEDIKDLKEELGKFVNPMITPEQARSYEAKIVAKLKDLEKQLKDYEKAYADLVGAAGTASLLDLDTCTALTSTTKVAIKAIYDAIDTNSNPADVEVDDAFNEDVTEFVNAYNADEAADTAYQTELANWTAAKKAYNDAVGEAKKAYDKVVNDKTAGTPQPGTDVEYADHSSSIVPMYSARREATQSGAAAAAHGTDVKRFDPTLNTTSDYLTAANYPNDWNYYDDLLASATTPVGLPPAGSPTSLVMPAPNSDADVNANTTFDDSTYKDGTPATTIKTLYEAVYGDGTNDGSKKKYEDALLAYETAQATADATSKITIYVNLADDYANYWQYAGDTDATGTLPTQNAEFYYRYLLQPGETSHKLIDSVELADTVTATDYKNLTFDLNVTLDSAQITYADDQRTITTEAVDSNTAFKLKVEENNPESLDDQFSWVDRDATSDPIYKVGTTKVDMHHENKAVGATTYAYWFSYDNATYVGNDDHGTFSRVTAGGDALEPDSVTDYQVSVAKT